MPAQFQFDAIALILADGRQSTIHSGQYMRKLIFCILEAGMQVLYSQARNFLTTAAHVGINVRTHR